jgi:hypothetical protein
LRRNKERIHLWDFLVVRPFITCLSGEKKMHVATFYSFFLHYFIIIGIVSSSSLANKDVANLSLNHVILPTSSRLVKCSNNNIIKKFGLVHVDGE